MRDSSSSESEDGVSGDAHMPFVKAFNEFKSLRGDSWLHPGVSHM